MTRPLDERIDSMVADLDAGALVLEPDVISLLCECQSALQTAREDGAREERDRIVTWLQTQAVFNRGISCFASAFACDSAASAIENGKHRP